MLFWLAVTGLFVCLTRCVQPKAVWEETVVSKTYHPFFAREFLDGQLSSEAEFRVVYGGLNRRTIKLINIGNATYDGEGVLHWSSPLTCTNDSNCTARKHGGSKLWQFWHIRTLSIGDWTTTE